MFKWIHTFKRFKQCLVKHCITGITQFYPPLKVEFSKFKSSLWSELSLSMSVNILLPCGVFIEFFWTCLNISQKIHQFMAIHLKHLKFLHRGSTECVFCLHQKLYNSENSTGQMVWTCHKGPRRPPSSTAEALRDLWHLQKNYLSSVQKIDFTT